MQKKETVEVVKNKVILSLTQDLQRLSLQLINSLRGRSRIKYGMTALYNNGGFTLIELLVVVLIIGILVAVAVPQYQKAVERSKATQALTLLKSIAQAAESYYLANGKEIASFDDLDISIPWTGTTKVVGVNDVKSNDQWSLELQKSGGWHIVYMYRNTGKYQGAGFTVVLHSAKTGTHATKFSIGCSEQFDTSSTIKFDSSLPPGAYCEQIMKAIYAGEDNVHRFYSLK